jgi:DNA repair photolyase
MKWLGSGRAACKFRRELRRIIRGAILNRVESPDIPGDWTLNPYRGCEHGCVYCYARPGHEYFGLSCGLDFEARLFAKHDAPELLRQMLRDASWKCDSIALSGVTDPYQALERDLCITRGCLEVCAEARQAVSVITKNRLVTRDRDLLGELAKLGAAHEAVSVTSLDRALGARIPPITPPRPLLPMATPRPVTKPTPTATQPIS